MLQNLTWIFVVCLINIAVIGVWFYVMKSNTNEWLKNINKDYIVVHLPKAYRWIGWADILFFSFLLSLDRWQKNDYPITTRK